MMYVTLASSGGLWPVVCAASIYNLQTILFWQIFTWSICPKASLNRQQSWNNFLHIIRLLWLKAGPQQKQIQQKAYKLMETGQLSTQWSIQMNLSTVSMWLQELVDLLVWYLSTFFMFIFLLEVLIPHYTKPLLHFIILVWKPTNARTLFLLKIVHHFTLWCSSCWTYVTNPPADFGMVEKSMLCMGKTKSYIIP